MYHDPLIGLKTNIGFEFEDGKDISIFDGCDFVCCGDIHLYQVMDYHGIPIVQPSSMIQQDFGERVIHGLKKAVDALFTQLAIACTVNNYGYWFVLFG